MASTKPQLENKPGRSDELRRNSNIFSALTLVTHVLACFMFGFFFVIPAQENSSDQFAPIFISFGHGILVILGFGLLFSYLKKMAWSGIGFALLITALCFEFFFMFNAFWIKADVLNESQTSFSSESKTFNIYLSYSEQVEGYGSTITGAFRCSLAILIAFSSIIGRAGPLQIWIVSFFGSIGYELNRQIVENYAVDAGGAMTIFLFGSFMGLALGFFKRFREADEDTDTNRHMNYTANSFTASLALFGAIIIWIFYPIITFDYVNKFNGQNTGEHTIYTAPYAIMFAVAASTLSSVMVSVLFNRNIGPKDMIYGSVAGIVISSTASYYITNPVYAILIGFIGGVIQTIFNNTVEKNFAQSRNIFNTYSFTLFGLQAFLGCCFAAAWNAVSKEIDANDDGVNGDADGFQYSVDSEAVYEFVTGLISIPMGLGFGILAGIFVMLVSVHFREDHFTDGTYWLKDDGIRYKNQETVSVEEEDDEEEEEVHEVEVIGKSQVKYKHAYI